MRPGPPAPVVPPPALASEAPMVWSREIAMERRPHFFKVFFPCHSSKQLVIPPAFLKHIEVDTSGCISLMGPSGNVWNVHLAMNKDGGMAFWNGWEDFVLDHSLRAGDFLVFRYDGGPSFTVVIFDPTACEREEAFHVMPSDEVTILGESHRRKYLEDGLVDDWIIIDPKRDTPFPSKTTDRRESPPLAYQAFRKDHTCSVEILLEKRPNVNDGSLMTNDGNLGCWSYHEESSIHSESLCSCRKKIRRVTQKPDRLLAGKKSANEKNRSATKQTCNKISGVSASLSIGGAGTKVRRGTAESHPRAITKDEKAKALNAAQFFQSKHPFCLIVMRHSYVCYGFCLNLPISLMKHLPESSMKMKLWDPCNKPWKVRYVYKQGRGAFSGGWRKFSHAHNLEIDDVCVFELLKPCEMRVHIFRVR
uniref:B3 domain-containing protein Os11g0197600 n=1 Tax=Anthurium amnicola TaxID=1678845 RepID=A0A1D1YW08_9ARAE